jgi:2-amino-4-hydroxy-6-hydroxymethyldihydropteridine diphosphokinase
LNVINQRKHEYFLILGSNISPEANMAEAIRQLGQRVNILALSSVWETEAVGSPGPHFLNVVVKLESNFDDMTLKDDIIAGIENRLGRVRTSDRNAPRTMDLDILIVDDMIKDDRLWSVAYIVAPLSELLPDMRNPDSGESLANISSRLVQTCLCQRRQDLSWILGTQKIDNGESRNGNISIDDHPSCG